MRQIDKEFAEILNRIRERKYTQNDIEILKERILKLDPVHADYPITATHFFCTNMAVNQHDLEIINKSLNQNVNIKAIDIVLGDLSDDLKERMIPQKLWVYLP